MKQFSTFFILLLVLSLSVHATDYAFYPLDGDADDVSGNNRHGIEHGSPAYTTDRNGQANSAMQCDGVNDYIQFPEDFDFAPRSISMWIYPETFTVEGVPFSADNSGIQYGDSKIVVNESGGNYVLNIRLDNNLYTQTLVLNQWYQVTLVYDTSEIRYYINGGLVGTFFNMQNQHSGNGAVYATAGCHRNIINFFHGKMDDIRIYDNALTDEQAMGLFTDVQELSLVPFSLFPNPVSNTLHIDCNEACFIAVRDMSGHEVLQQTFAPQTDCGALASGVYAVELLDAKRQAIVRRRIVKQ